MKPDTFVAGAHVKVIDKSHPWFGLTGRLIIFEKYGPNKMFSGWRVKLENGIESYGKRDQLKEI